MNTRPRHLLPLLALLAACQKAPEPAAPAAGARANPLLRMPGTQPGQVTLTGSAACHECHGGGDRPFVKDMPDGRGRTDYEEYNLFKAWQGSMMGNAARDPLMFACFTVAAQDSKHVLGSYDAVDLCLRCHFPKGWLEGRSSTLNASAMTGEDYDGIQCSFCHRLQDPLAKATFDEAREGGTLAVHFDEQNSPQVAPAHRSAARAAETWAADQGGRTLLDRFSGGPLYEAGAPFSPAWDEAGAGQFVVSPDPRVRGPFADVDEFPDGASSAHGTLYSRFHKGKFICGTCHDVSNPIMANLDHAAALPGQPGALPSEALPAYAWSHVERTFSEYRLSAYDAPGGAPGKGNFRPNTPKGTFPVNGWETDQPDNWISKCQDCHMCSRYTPGANDPAAPVRPEDSKEHPGTWTPCHAMTGGNVWVSDILASIAPGNASPDAVNTALLVGRAAELTLDPMQGTWTSLSPANIAPGQTPPNVADALLLAATRNRGVLGNAASISDLSYLPATGKLAFRVQNNTGHKLISGFPEGRRMFVNVVVRQGGQVVQEINPYDRAVGTLKGLPGVPSSPALGAQERYVDELVYEVHMRSAITGEERSFHFALATGRSKDNRIQPKGFDIAGAGERLVEPVWNGVSDPGYFTAAEYAGGYDEVHLDVPAGADEVEVKVYYQTTSREYVEFLRDEINGTGRLSLPASAYVVQSDPFFAGLRRWGDTIFALWEHNKDKDGGAPFLMTRGTWTLPTPLLRVAR